MSVLRLLLPLALLLLLHYSDHWRNNLVFAFDMAHANVCGSRAISRKCWMFVKLVPLFA